MKNLIVMLMAAVTIAACSAEKSKDEFVLDNSLTNEERENGILTPEILWKFAMVGEPIVSPDGTMLLYVQRHTNLAQNTTKSILYVKNLLNNEVVQLTSTQFNASNPRWSKDGLSIRYISDQIKPKQMFVIDAKSKNASPQQISDMEDGVENFEFSPLDDKIVFAKKVKMKKTSSDIYPELKEAKVRIITDLMYRHWDTWADEKCSHLFIASYAMNKIVGQKDITPSVVYDIPMAPHYNMSDVCWNSDGTKIYYAAKPLVGKQAAISTNSSIFCYDLASDSSMKVMPNSDGYDTHPSVSPDGTFLAWLSMETAGYESDKNRLMIKNLIDGNIFEATRSMEEGATTMAWNSDSHSIYFISGTKATYQVFVYDFESVRQLTSGLHDYNALSCSKDVLVGRKMSKKMAPEIFVINKKDGSDEQVTFANKHIYDNIKLGSVEERWIRTADWKDMHSLVIYPPNFNSESTYPCILYCQGGPQSAVSQSWSQRWNLQLFAAQGYIVIAPNRRGVPTFGKYWLNQISGDYSGLNISDYYSAIDDIKKEPYIDKNRLGAMGASYGGYSVYYLAGTHNKRFKAFFAHCGMFNLESMYGSTEEMFFVNYDLKGPYWSSDWNVRQIYKNSPHNFVSLWDTPILISEGEHDYRIPYTEGLQAFTAAQMRNIPSKLLFFPEETHFVSKPQNAVLWHKEQIDWFDTYLKYKEE
jgi:dipeptidyl aminopeptidase/acylaminoacyl peptidase